MIQRELFQAWIAWDCNGICDPHKSSLAHVVAVSGTILYDMILYDTKCLFAVVVVLMVEDTITIPTQWSEAVTELSLWTFMFQVCPLK